jgi:hypothetical protein
MFQKGLDVGPNTSPATRFDRWISPFENISDQIDGIADINLSVAN